VLANGVKYVAPASSAPAMLGGRNRPIEQSLSPIRSK
jgi:hypothetical protein